MTEAHLHASPQSQTLEKLPSASTTAPTTYTVADIARLTQSSTRHIFRLIDMGKVPGRVKGLGRLVRFSRSAVDAWLGGDRTLARA